MKTFWRLQEVDYYSVAIDLKRRIPDLKHVDYEWIADHLKGSNLLFYRQEKAPIPFYMRLTLIPALVVLVILFIGLPINYLITGYWRYNWLWLKNWFTSLGF
jgi:hypothetical protein